MMGETTVPRSIIICGGGPTGLEFAYVMASFGAAVTLIEAESRLLPSADPELSSELTKSLRAACVTIMTGHRVDRVLPSGEGAEVEVSPPMGGLARRLTADKVLIAFGQTPATTGFGLEKVGVEMTDGQGIAVDDRGRTSVPGVYAIGDVTGGLMQADLAQSQGVVAAETIAGVQTFPPDPAMTPHHVGCAPQAAWFGLTESQARAAGHDPVVSKYPLAVNGQACAMGITDGFVKIVADRAHHEVLGAHVVGPGAAELLPQLTMAQLWDLTADEVATVIPIHPTLSEAVSQAALGVSGHMITF
jgi:dihydrolipoamide dehydrogenase